MTCFRFRGLYMGFLCFFFSSRRRHTRCGRDWSSDVCSSDLTRRGTPIRETKLLPPLLHRGHERRNAKIHRQTIRPVQRTIMETRKKTTHETIIEEKTDSLGKKNLNRPNQSNPITDNTGEEFLTA